MASPLQHHAYVRVGQGRVVHRRDVLRLAGGSALASAGLLGGPLSLPQLVQLHAADLRKRQMSCIVLWMQGGPSQFETFSPKPEHANGGGTKAIATNVAGIEYSENLPELAKVADRLSVIRSMTSKEGSHPRATFLMHTGYLPSPSVRYPALGSIAAREVPHLDCELPAFVRIGGAAARLDASAGGGFLGAEFDPFSTASNGRTPDNTKPTTPTPRYNRRLGLLNKLESDYAASEGKEVVAEHRKLYEKAARMIQSSQMQAFEIDRENAATRERYGSGEFATGCLLARRLVESGVTFIEVMLNGWDTHQDNFTRSKQLCENFDKPFAALLADLADRGMLDSTLVCWMGEFGRTPRVNPRSGRDHYPRAFNLAVAGGGVKGGQVIGSTDDSGSDVRDRPVAVQDLLQSLCKSLKIDAKKEIMSPIGRPIRIVDGGQPVAELFG